MIRKRTKEIEVCPPYPGTDYSGNPYTKLQGRWWDSTGIQHHGDVELFDIVGQGMGFDPKPGDVLTITIEVNTPNEEEL